MAIIILLVMVTTVTASANGGLSPKPSPEERTNNQTIQPAESLAQQKREVKGKVTDKDGAGIPGASVLIKGTTIGTITDSNGNFSLLLPEGAKALVFSFVGMKRIEVSVGNKSFFKVVLEEASVGLDEVVAIAYGKQKKMTITGAVSSVTGDELLKTPTGSISNALSGAVTGLSSVQ